MQISDDRAALALEVCRLLAAAYDAATGVPTMCLEGETFVDWEDIDAAHRVALQALGRMAPPARRLRKGCGGDPAEDQASARTLTA
jgi:hypothetical protein